MRKLQTCYLDNHVQDARKRNHKNRWNVIATVISLFFVIISVSNLYRVEAPSFQQNDPLKTIQPFISWWKILFDFSFSVFSRSQNRCNQPSIYLWSISILVRKKKKLYKYLYVYRMHTQLFSIATSLLLLLEKNIKKKKEDERRMNLKAATFIFINTLAHLIIVLFN